MEGRMKKLVIFLFLAVTGLNVVVTGREPRIYITDKDQSLRGEPLAMLQDTTKRTEQHTGKAVRDHELEEQMKNDPDNRDRSIPNTRTEHDSTNVPEL